MRQWEGWEGDERLPLVQSDSCEFGQFLLNSVTRELYNFFKIKMDFENDINFEPDSPFHKKFFLKLVLNSNDIQTLINNKMRDCINLRSLPNYLFISLLRNDGFGLRNEYIDIKTFITIRDTNYKFLGASNNMVPKHHFLGLLLYQILKNI